MADEPVKPGSDGRDDKGKFVKGNQCGVGNQNGLGWNNARKIIMGQVDANPKAIEAAALQLLKKAAAGDMEAIKYLLTYPLGKPLQEIDLGVSGGMEVDIPLDVLRHKARRLLDDGDGGK